MEEHVVIKAKELLFVNVHHVIRARNVKNHVSDCYLKKMIIFHWCIFEAACFSNPCLNQGICEAFNETVYFCNCPARFTGQRCESIVPGKIFLLFCLNKFDFFRSMSRKKLWSFWKMSGKSRFRILSM
jgi:hypothetical protein